jgi:hypothetical protein
MTEEDIKKLQSTGGEALAATEKNILGNDLNEITERVAKMENGRIDFVLDNAGFELYCDVSLAPVPLKGVWVSVGVGMKEVDPFNSFAGTARLCRLVDSEWNLQGDRLPWEKGSSPFVPRYPRIPTLTPPSSSPWFRLG